MSADEAPALFGVDQVARQMGPLERTVRQSLQQLQLDTRDEGGAELAAQLAALIDTAQLRKRDYAAIQAARELREQLVRLRADPASRMGNDAGELSAFLADLATPTKD